MGIGRRMFAGALLILVAASPVLAEEGARKDPQKYLDQLTGELELTDQQRSQVEQIMNDYRPRFEALRSQLDALKQEKHDKIKAVLTPEQQEKYEQMQQHKEHHDKSQKPEG